MQGYLTDLAYIHDAGHGGYSLNAAAGLLRILRSRGVTSGLIVDLGCGSGHWARELNRAGYRVLGIDQSPSMIRLARKKAPAAKFHVASFHAVPLPPCDGVTSIGECLNYRFDKRNGRRAMARLFRRVYAALRPGGVFIFDLAGPGRMTTKVPQAHWKEGSDWAVLVSSQADSRDRFLTRRIIAFRKAGRLYRRSEEIHHLELYRPADLVQALVQCGFQCRALSAYGRFRLPPGMAAIVAIKPF